MHRHIEQNALVVGQHALGLLPLHWCSLVQLQARLEHFVMARFLRSHSIAPVPEFYPSANVPRAFPPVCDHLLSLLIFFCAVYCAVFPLALSVPVSYLCKCWHLLRFCVRSTSTLIPNSSTDSDSAPARTELAIGSRGYTQPSKWLPTSPPRSPRHWRVGQILFGAPWAG